MNFFNVIWRLTLFKIAMSTFAGIFVYYIDIGYSWDVSFLDNTCAICIHILELKQHLYSLIHYHLIAVRSLFFGDGHIYILLILYILGHKFSFCLVACF
ncbi:hypothetical protein GDO86_008354 [Hymenochirus boettgeri]|uniref:Uncharacterized protein n=1 Tax=Hymenochirus boettgeri TaxID=247094 RepID=A0A8T2J2M5_9PIPI|nr:hypothetical protein GDO86_008354 [Hymenochirus boettgeri]